MVWHGSQAAAVTDNGKFASPVAARAQPRSGGFGLARGQDLIGQPAGQLGQVVELGA